MVAALFMARPIFAQETNCAPVLMQSGDLKPGVAFRRAECLAEAGYLIAAREEFTKISQRLDVESSMIARAETSAQRLRPTEPTLVVRVGELDEEPDVVRLDGQDLPSGSLNRSLTVTSGEHVVEAWYFPVGTQLTSKIHTRAGLYEVELPRLVTTASSLPKTGEVLLGVGGSLSLFSGLGFFGMLSAYANAETEAEEEQFAEALPPLGVTFSLTLGILVTGVVFVLAPTPPSYSTEPLKPPAGVTPPTVELWVSSIPRLRVLF